jgi:hypothetical protein
MRISFNKILQVVNWGSVFTLWCLFNNFGGNYYIDETTILLTTLLALETHLFLIYAKKNNNSLLLIFSFLLVIYYILRIPTLLFTSYSVVFTRFLINCSDSNFALFFIIISNLFLFTGIHFAKNTIKNKLPDSLKFKTSKKDYKIILLIIFAFFLTFSNFLKIDSITKLTGYIQQIFINAGNILFMCIVYFIYFYDSFSKKIKLSIILLLLLFVVILSLNGSRSGILSIVVYLLIANIAIYNTINFKIIHVIGITLLIPIAFIIFLLSTYSRAVITEKGGNYFDKIEIIKSYDLEKISDDKMIYAPVFDRIGYFDYATEIIAHKVQYSDIFSLKYYFASIIDNVLTPGFNIFDTPKVSNALIYKYSNMPKLSLKSVSELYHSDQITIYGEYYSLFFGWASLVIFFFTGYIFQKIYDLKNRLGGCKSAIQKGIVLSVFFTLINSFGLDWLLFNIMGFYFCYFLFEKLIFKNENTYTNLKGKMKPIMNIGSSL